HDIHILLAEISGNATLRLFIEVLTHLTHESGGPGEFFVPGTLAARPRRNVEDLHRAHVLISEAVISGDPALASRRMLKHLQAIESYIANRRRTGSKTA